MPSMDSRMSHNRPVVTDPTTTGWQRVPNVVVGCQFQQTNSEQCKATRGDSQDLRSIDSQCHQAERKVSNKWQGKEISNQSAVYTGLNIRSENEGFTSAQ